MLAAIGANLVGNVSADGMQWLDPDDKPPVLTDQGRLREPFVLVTYRSNGTIYRSERWAPPARLPLTPAAYRAKLKGTAADTGAAAGNSQGEEVAVDSPETKSVTRPVPKPSAKKAKAGPKVSTRLSVVGNAKTVSNGTKVKDSAATKPAGKADAKNMDGGPSRPANGIVHLRRMRTPHEGFVLIKNPQVFGQDSNWATKETFKTADAAMTYAKAHDLKVANPPK